MTSYNTAMAPRPAVYGGPSPVPDPAAPAGTFAPGTKIQVGNHKVVIQKYFSEGGFAHVYLVKMPKPIDGTDIAVLKRVAVPDKENLANMRTEVETMKKLKGHRPIVTYYDSHASQLKGGGYEVFLLMEFCSGGGLIDFMNTRLQNRLTEPEILKIFSDVSEGVACMHYLKPPLLHRDLKVENVLITASSSGGKRFKVCDFGSTAPPRPAGTTAAECRLIEDDVQKHTTLQYRSPEMVDVYRKLPIDEKSDIWALGVLLYKLCYYTTPFEAQGQLAILNASFKFPAYPIFSDALKRLIASMLKEKPTSRPNIYQVLREACMMQGIPVPIKDIYAGRTESESRRYQQLPATESAPSPPVSGAVYVTPVQQKNVIPDVTPMRRGRPTGSTQLQSRPGTSPMRAISNDPWASLDAKSPLQGSDDLSNRFPSLNEFSLLHDGGKFDFGSVSSHKTPFPSESRERATEKLADDAFSIPPRGSTAQPSVSRAQQILSSNNLELQTSAVPATPVYQPAPIHPTNSAYVSQGTMTSQTPTPPSSYSPAPRFPTSSHSRAPSLSRSQASIPARPPAAQYEKELPVRVNMTKSTSSARPSLEMSRPSSESLANAIPRTKSSMGRPRPSSQYLESNMDFLREKEGRPSMEKRPSFPKDTAAVESEADETNIASNVDFLRKMEDSESSKHKRKTSSSSRHSKRSSLPSMSLSGTKTLLAGKFGDAFKRFENNASAPPGPRTPSPLQDLERRDLTPIAGSEATDGRSDDGNILEDMDNLPPERRREIERQRLEAEEQRVANAAAEYRKRLADRGTATTAPRSIGGVSRAASIQNKVKTLLDENQQPSPKKAAEGYGRYTDAPSSQATPLQPSNPYNKELPRQPLAASSRPNEIDYSKPRPSQPLSQPLSVSRTGPRTMPKPTHLNNAATDLRSSSPLKDMYRPVQARPDMTAHEKEEYAKDFSKRFPSLGSIELVERDIAGRDKD